MKALDVQRRFTFPEKLSSQILTEVNRLGFSIERPGALARAICELSDLYNAGLGSDRVWIEPKFRAAYLVYFFPLNFVRCQAVIQEGKTLGFFDPLTAFVEWGSGPGTFHLASLHMGLKFKEKTFFDISSRAHELHQSFTFAMGLENSQFVTQKVRASGLGVFSYSLNEMKNPTEDLLNFSDLLILEPSTQENTRQLMALRQKLIDSGYFAWAPCTHQKPCPLLTHSKTDWCHDRVFFQMPTFFKQLEQHLPMKNESVTFSYLLASRREALPLKQARIIGDTLHEKGKVRQMVCQGSEREFLSWLTRQGEPAPIPRGSLFEIPEGVVKKGSELRMPVSS